MKLCTSIYRNIKSSKHNANDPMSTTCLLHNFYFRERRLQCVTDENFNHVVTCLDTFLLVVLLIQLALSSGVTVLLLNGINSDTHLSFRLRRENNFNDVIIRWGWNQSSRK